MTFEEFKNIYQKAPVEVDQNELIETPLVSVCVQTYQHASFIQECLDGILMQETDFRFEILIGEDASADGTREICVEYAKRFPDIIRLFLHDRRNNIFINGKQTGRFNFLNNIFNSRGKYIAFCEGDDSWTDPLKLKKQIDFLKSNLDFSGVGCYNDRLEYHGDNSIKVSAEANLQVLTYDFRDLYKKSIRGSRTCTMVYRRTGPLVNFPSWAMNVLSGDRVIVFSMLKNVGKICVLPFIGAIYRVHPGGVWSSLSKKQIRINLQLNYETLSYHIFDTYFERLCFFWLHFRRTIRHDMYSLNIRYVFRSLRAVFIKRKSSLGR